MRCRLIMLLSLGVIAIPLLPAAASSRGLTAGLGFTPPPRPDPPAALGEPWTGTWMRMSPSSLKKTRSRTVWVEIAGFFDSWADGAPGGTSANNFDLMPIPAFSGGAKFVDWGRPMTIAGFYDQSHSGRSVVAYFCGRVKLRLTAGHGRKVIKVQFEAKVSNERNGTTFDPLHPFSPVYRTKVTRVR
jgi:hypothetical protein